MKTPGQIREQVRATLDIAFAKIEARRRAGICMHCDHAIAGGLRSINPLFVDHCPEHAVGMLGDLLVEEAFDIWRGIDL